MWGEREKKKQEKKRKLVLYQQVPQLDESIWIRRFNRVAGVCGKVTGIFSVLPSLPTSSLFLAVTCFCLPLGWKMQCKIVLEMLGLPVSINPYPKVARPQPQLTSSTALSGPSNLLVLPAQQLCFAPVHCWGGHGLLLQSQESRRSSMALLLPHCPHKWGCAHWGRVKECRKGGGAADGQVLGWRHWYCSSSSASQFWYSLVSRPHRVSVLPWFLSYTLPLIPTLRDVKEGGHS